MTTFYQKTLIFFSNILGEEPARTMNFQPSSKKRIITLGSVLFIPVILWFINTYLMVANIIGAHQLTAFVAALIVAFIVFLLERGILMSRGGIWMAIFRVLLGLCMAFLGAICLDQLIFKADIDNKVQEYQVENADNAINKVKADYQRQITLLEASVAKKANVWEKALIEAKSEADGTGGSHQKKVGRIAKLKIDVADKHQADYQQERQQLQQIKADFEREKHIAQTSSTNSFKSGALLLRVKAMHALVKQDKEMGIIYLFLTCVLLFIEMIPVIIKMGWKKSIDEELSEARDQLLRFKTQKLIIKHQHMFNADNHLPQVQEANKYLNSNLNSIFNN